MPTLPALHQRKTIKPVTADVTCSKSHTRHPHSGSAHRRSIRADTKTSSFSYNLAAAAGAAAQQNKKVLQVYAKQNDKILLECAVNINFSTSIWLKDGQIVQTILKDNSNNKRVIGHRFLVDVSGNLLIDNVRLEDDGRWQCEAEDAFGFVVQGRPVQLTVLGQHFSIHHAIFVVFFEKYEFLLLGAFSQVAFC
nr:unnamed protein product [Callosobruchus analis]